MERYNIVFIETEWSRADMLGRRVEDFVIREFESFGASVVRIAKKESYKEESALLPDCVNVVLTLDMPLARQSDVVALAKKMKKDKINCVHLGAMHSLAKICVGNDAKGGVFSSSSAFFKIDDAKSYNLVYNRLKDELLDKMLARGVRILDKATTFVDDTAKIESGATILPFCRIEGESFVSAKSVVSASYIRDSVIDGANVEWSHIVCSHVHARATVGPYARLRRAVVGEGCRVGDFVEVKASTLEKGVKASHLSYIGDAEVGERTNVGCGTVFCNFDGKNKNKTTVGCDCFLGANTNLVAPLVVGDKAFIAAGTTVTRDVDDSTFTIGRVRQDTVKNERK